MVDPQEFDIKSLSEDNETQDFTLDELNSKEELPVLDPSPKSKNMLLGASAVAGASYDEDMEEVANAKVMGEDAVQGIIERIKNDSYQNNLEALQEIVLDPELSDEIKSQAIAQITEQGEAMFSLSDEVTVKALGAAVPKNAAEERFQLDLSNRVEEINAFKARKQSAINLVSISEDQTSVDKFLDIAEMIAIPFSEQIFFGEMISAARGGDASAFFEVVTMLGSSKEAFRNSFKDMTIEQRELAFTSLIGIISDNKNIVLPMDNYLQVQDFLNTTMGEEDYSTGEKWFDNVFGWLEVTGLAGWIRKTSKAGKLKRDDAAWDKVVEEASKVKVKGQASASSVAENVRDISPDAKKDVHKKMVDDPSDETAEALYGTSRSDAIADDVLPEIGRDGGSVRDKPFLVDEDIKAFRETDGKQELTDAEIESARQTVRGKFRESIPFVVDRAEMSTVADTPTGLSVQKYYGPADYGWTSAAEAIRNVDFGLRDLGITEDMMQLVVKKGDEYVPISRQEADDMITLSESGAVVKFKGQDGQTISPNFLVRVDYDYRVSPTDIKNFSEEGITSLNYFDRFKAFTGKNRGSFTRHLLDAASIFKGRLFRGASVAVDRSSEMERRLLMLSEKYANTFVKLPKERQQALDFTIKEDNLKGLKFDKMRYKANGHTDVEIEALQSWKNTWDTMYWLDNKDLIDSLVSQNFKKIVTASGDTELYARRIGNKSVPKGAKIYDPLTDTFTVVNDKMLNELKASDGYIAAMRRPSQHGEDFIEFVRVEEKADTSYAKRISPSDQVLNYRNGYYTVTYNAPRYIVERVKDRDGNILYEKAVATAGNRLDAETMTSRMNRESDDPNKYYTREDIKGGTEQDDMDWDMQSALGRTSQKVRGDRLGSAKQEGALDIHDASVDTPIDSLVRSVRSMSRRTSVRDWLDTSKTRFVEQYGDILSSRKFGEATFPNSMEQIGVQGVRDKRLADARTTYEYIRYMEEGYINSVDDLSKAGLNFISELFGSISVATKNKALSKSASKLEEGFNILADTSLTSTAKGAAFQLYLAANPLRQLLVQSHQGVQLTATHTKYVASQNLAMDMMFLYSKKMGLPVTDDMLKTSGRKYNTKQLDEMYAQYEASGLAATIDKGNLVRDSLNRMIQDTKFSSNPVSRGVGKALNYSRKAGFDAGEEINIMSSWLAHRDEMVQSKGRFDLDIRELGDVGAKARNYTYGMNAAGDMPYNLNWLSIPFQFLQVPHKAMLTMTTNKNIPRSQKVRLAVFNSVFYTLPTAAMIDIFGDSLPEDEELRAMIVQGAEGYLLNLALSGMVGEDVGIDISSLAPLDMYGTYAFLEEFFTGNFIEAFTKSPSGSLVFGTNPRVTNLMRTVGQLVTFDEDLPPSDLSDVAKSFAELFSGLSNTFKAAYALKYGQALSSSGAINDENVNTPEALGMLLGLPTLDQSYDYYVKNALYKDKKELSDDVKQWYGTMKQILSDKGIQNRGNEYALTVVREGWRVFGDDQQKAREMLMGLIKQDAMKGDDTTRNAILKMAGIYTNEEIRKMMRDMPEKDSTGKPLDKDAYIRNLDAIDEAYRKSKEQ